jgi:hypothetical protein
MNLIVARVTGRRNPENGIANVSLSAGRMVHEAPFLLDGIAVSPVRLKQAAALGAAQLPGARGGRTQFSLALRRLLFPLLQLAPQRRRSTRRMIPGGVCRRYSRHSTLRP